MHHTAICEKVPSNEAQLATKKDENEDILVKPEVINSFHVSTMNSVLLQTAHADMCDIDEKRVKRVRVLLDPGSQKSYISLKAVDALKLNPVCEEQLIIKTFGDAAEKSMRVKEYQFVIKSIDGASLYLKGYGVPKICSTLSGQEIEVARDKFPFFERGGNL